ncbi:SEC1-family transport protein SLY1 [Zea mays]|nr:SEC1-family transport protein SLY1 [Zea mays]ACG27831.1 SEC1-family transport protein SLY1 [Zea mays]ACN25272.1 unknown [Zea mays]AQK55183.1 SEC1 family transport protein SLY1 [Zea mays]|eukprot:NP_001146668.1 SEC1-family transport protein SLY1 [Zea mays]
MAALSLRQRQLDLIVRMLHLNKPPPPPGTAAEQEEEVYKILVLDSFCLSLLSPLLRVADLRKHGVTLYFPIDKPRQQVADAPAVYFLRPTQANADRVAADAAASLYASFHLNFSSALPRPLLDRLAAATAASGSAHRVARLADQYLDFVSLEDNLFSLAHPRSYVALNDPKAADADIEALVDAIALGLFCAAATLGTVPVIRCPRGGPAEMVAAALDARLRHHLLAKPNLFTEASASASVASFQRPVLCLFDRNLDLSVGIQHDWSYRPLVHDVLGLKLNKLKMPADKSGPAKAYDLDDSDAFWVANSWSPFPRVAEEIESQLAKYKQDVDEVNQRTGGNKDGIEFDGTDLIGNTQHLMNAVNSLPELTERKKMIDKHTNIATALLGHIKERSLDGYCDCGNDMLTKGTVDRSTLLGLLRGKGTKADKLRLAVTYLLCFETPELEQVEAALRESEVDMSAFQYVKRIKSLNTQFSASSSSSATRSNIVDWAEKLYGQSISAVTAGVKNLLSSGRQLALTRTVEALMEGKPNPEVDNYLLFDPRAPRSGSGGQFKGPFREAIVFMIGGGNYIEYRSLMELAECSQPPSSKHVIYGATEIVNGVEFIEQLAELGQKAGLGLGGGNNPPLQ